MPDTKIEPTGAMVDAALDSWFPEGWRRYGEAHDWRKCMRAALTAALALVTPGAGFRAGAEWAAGIIDRGQQTFSTGGTGPGKRHLSPRAHGNIDGLAYAEAIRTELAALPEGGDGWGKMQSMATAPEDGTDILLCALVIEEHGVTQYVVGYWQDDGDYWESAEAGDRIEYPLLGWFALPSSTQATPPAISPPLCDDAGGGT